MGARIYGQVPSGGDVIKIIVDNGALEVWCMDKRQAHDYIKNSLRRRGYKTFSIWEMKENGEQKQIEGRGQIQAHIQEPTEVRKGGVSEGL